MNDHETRPPRYSEKEVGEILRRATELQQTGSAGGAEEGLTLEELEDIASEAGIPSRFVRRAAAELGSGPPSPKALWSRLAGASLRLSFERAVGVEIEPDAFAELVPLMQVESLGQGTASVVGRTLTWTSRSDTNTSSQQVSVTTGEDETVIHAEERLGGMAAALHGGLIGGVGGGVGIGGGVALATSMGSAVLAFALPVGVVAVSYAAARWIFSFEVGMRRERLEILVERLAERIERLGRSPGEGNGPGEEG